MNNRNARYLIVFIAVVLRVLFLEWKSPHFDEGINGHFVMQIWNDGFFTYDPTNFHGPLYFYYLQFAELLMSRGIFAFRFATALLSIGCVLVTLAHSRFFGRAAYWAAAVMAISPAFVFYGRYAIHETLLILAQLVFSYGFWKWRFDGGKRAVYYMVGGTLAALATKETFFIFLATWLIAWGVVEFAQKILPKKVRARDEIPSGKNVGGVDTWLTATAIGVTLVVVLFSGFFNDHNGVNNMFRAFAFWTKTGTGATGHEKPFFYWVKLLSTYEWPLLFALAVTPLVWFFSSIWMRFFSLAGFGLWLAYSIVPYKTPWCLIGFWPLAFALGFLINEIKKPIVIKAITTFALALMTVSLFTSLRLNFRDYQSLNEPYVYVQSRPDLNEVTDLLKERVKLAPEDQAMPIQLALQDTWPLPWLLSLYPGTNFSNNQPAQALEGAGVILADAARALELEPTLKTRYYKRQFQVRDAYNPGYAYFEFSKFKGLLPDSTEIVGPQK